MYQPFNRSTRRALVSVLLVAILSSSAAAPRVEAGPLFPILGAPFRAIGALIGFRRNSGFAFPILGAPFRAVARIRDGSPFAFPFLGAPFRFLAGLPVFANQSVEGSLP